MLISEYREFLCRIKDEKIPAIKSAFNEDLVKDIHSKRVSLENLIMEAEASGTGSPEQDPSILEALFHIDDGLAALFNKQNALLDEITEGIDNTLTDIGFVSDDKSLTDPGIFDVIPELHRSVHISTDLAQSYEAILDNMSQGDYPLVDILEREYAALDQMIMLLGPSEAVDKDAIWMQLYENIDYLKQQQAIPIP